MDAIRRVKTKTDVGVTASTTSSLESAPSEAAPTIISTTMLMLAFSCSLVRRVPNNQELFFRTERESLFKLARGRSPI